MLTVDGLTKRFGEVQALDGMSFSVEDGQLVGFIGPNGAGKTTTMRSILGLLRPDEGSVRWNGAPVDAGVRAHFGYMPEERGLYPRMRVLDQIVYFARLAGMAKGDADRSARTWLERLDLDDRAGDELSALSHGNQQRVQLAVALVHDPDLLVLDEPFSGLDPIAAETMRALLAERAASGAAVLFSSHQLEMVEDLCRRVVIVNGGRVVAAGSVDELRAAQPTRVLEVMFASPPDAPTAAPAIWAPDLTGIRALSDDRGRQRFEVPADLHLDVALEAARRHGEIVQFAFEPPDLAVVFRNAIAGAGAGAGGDDGGGASGSVAPTAGVGSSTSDRPPSPDGPPTDGSPGGPPSAAAPDALGATDPDPDRERDPDPSRRSGPDPDPASASPRTPGGGA